MVVFVRGPLVETDDESGIQGCVCSDYTKVEALEAELTRLQQETKSIERQQKGLHIEQQDAQKMVSPPLPPPETGCVSSVIFYVFDIPC